MQIEIEQFKNTVEAIDPSTIVAMAKAGPETQAKLLKGLGLQGYMIVDGKHTVNLMGAAGGMLVSKWDNYILYEISTLNFKVLIQIY